MLPTYILPYFGSNSAVIGAASLAAAGSTFPTFWYHATILYVLIMLAWARGYYVQRRWIWIFPTIAFAFDLLPVLNWIPLVPTAMHICALIFGVMTAQATQATAGASAKPLSAGPSRVGTLVAYAGLGLFVLIAASTTATFKSFDDRINADIAKGVPFYRAGRSDGSPTGTLPATGTSAGKPAQAGDHARISMQGIGPVRFGMTVKEASAALRQPLSMTWSEGSQLAWLTDKQSYLLAGSDNRIFAGCTTSPRFTTSDGVRPADSIQKMHQVYSGKLKFDGRNEYKLSSSDPSDNGNSIVFSTYEGKVLKVCAGPPNF